MFNIIPLILILLGLAAIIVIVVRKFSILANLDIDNIPAEREAKFKEQIIGKRMKRNFLKYYSRLARIIGPLGEAIGNLFKWLHERLLEFKENNGFCKGNNLAASSAKARSPCISTQSVRMPLT